MTREVSREVGLRLGWREIRRVYFSKDGNPRSVADYALALARDQETLDNAVLFRAEGRGDFLNAWERA